MENIHFESLLELFYSPSDVIPEGYYVLNGKKIELAEFHKYAIKLASRFIGECNRNIEYYTNKPDLINRDFVNIRDKFHQAYIQEYGQAYYENNTPDLNNIAVKSDLHEYTKIALEAKLNAYTMAFNYLNTNIKTIPEKEIAVKKKRNRPKANIRDFRSKYSEDKLRSKYKEARTERLISRDTDPNEFVKIFKGIPTSGKINWEDTIYTLNKFINGINGKAIQKLTDGKWDVISRLFLVYGKPIKPESLKNPSKGKWDRIDTVKILIDEFNEENLL